MLLFTTNTNQLLQQQQKVHKYPNIRKKLFNALETRLIKLESEPDIGTTSTHPGTYNLDPSCLEKVFVKPLKASQVDRMHELN